MAPPSPQTPRKQPQTTPRTPGTPRRRKFPSSNRLQGIKPANLSITQIKEKLINKLKLLFSPEEWQTHLISRIRQGYDSIFCAGTGYGKSLIFEGLAALGGKSRAVIVISPLKALERDQVESASKKGIDAILINEDNTSTASLWKAARTSAQLIYISPEMALSVGFTKLWKDAGFRKRLQAIVIDEAHCVDEWGEEFRPQYRELSRLRHYTGQDVPFVACTATCSSKTFDIIWQSLGFGHRPFWGIDVGCGRPNLLFLTRVLENTTNPVLDVLNILPQVLDANTSRDAIDKSLFYFDSEEACRLAVRTLRKVLPEHLRDCVQPFSSDGSEAAKASCWEGFTSGRIRILCATDAAGMGCNVPDVCYSVIFGCPKSLSVIAQRWGRAARDRTLVGTCLLIVPDWAFRPSPPELGLAVQRVKGLPKIKVESKRRVAQRAALNSNVEAFINSGSENPRVCSHHILSSTFRPNTRLTTYSTLAGGVPSTIGARSQQSSHELSWTVLDLGRAAPASRCCNICNPHLLAPLMPACPNDPRLYAFANDFIHPIAQPPSRPSSPASVISSSSLATTTFQPIKGKQNIAKHDKDRLRTLLSSWLDLRHARRGGSLFISRNFGLPPKQMEKLVASCGRFLASTDIGKKEVLKIVKLDMASDEDFADISQVISGWCEGLNIIQTPASQRRARKKAHAEDDVRTPVAQPNFYAAAGPTSLTPRPGRIDYVQDENIFGTPITAPHASSHLSTRPAIVAVQSPSHMAPRRNSFATTSRHGPSSLSQTTPRMPPQPFTYFTPPVPPHIPYYSPGTSPYLVQQWSPVPLTQFYSRGPVSSPHLQPTVNYNIQEQNYIPKLDT